MKTLKQIIDRFLIASRWIAYWDGREHEYE